MPCWEVNLNTVEFKVENFELLEKAITSLGWEYARVGNKVYIARFGMQIDLDKQTVSYPRYSREDIVGKLKRQYSREVIKKAAKKKHWMLSEKSKTKYVAKRY